MPIKGRACESYIVQGLKPELRLWRLQAQVLTPTQGPVLETILGIVERQLPAAFPESSDLEVVEQLPRTLRALPAPFEGQGMCLEVTLSRHCGEDEINESFDSFMRMVSPSIQSVCPGACVLFSGVMSMSTSSTLGCDAQVGWHLPQALVQQQLGSALLGTVSWISLRSQSLTDGVNVLMFGEFAPAGAAPPTPKALAHAQRMAFAEQAWEELLPALMAWQRAYRLSVALPTDKPTAGPFSRL